MKTYLTITLCLSIFFCVAQETIIMKSGDTLIGSLTLIDDTRSRVLKPDGTSFIVLNDMIKEDIKKDPNISYEFIGENLTAGDAPKGHDVNSFFWGNSFDFAVMEFTNVIREGQSDKREQQRLENAKQQSLSKIGLIKSQYLSHSTYPEKIIDGWHNIVATDNSAFCKDAKVFVKDNKIKKFVIDNYVPLNFTIVGAIKNAKNIITLKNFNGEQLNIVEIYFVYDLEEQSLTSDPIEPVCICFWTDIKNYDAIQLKLNGVMMEKFTVQQTSQPNCFSNGTICRILKPGKHSFVGLGKGRINWKGTVDIKSGQCIKYRLGRNHW